MRWLPIVTAVGLVVVAIWSIDRAATEKAKRHQAEQAIESMSLAMQERERQYNAQQQVIADNRIQYERIETEIEAIRHANREELSTDACAVARIPDAVNKRLQQLTNPD